MIRVFLTQQDERCAINTCTLPHMRGDRKYRSILQHDKTSSGSALLEYYPRRTIILPNMEDRGRPYYREKVITLYRMEAVRHCDWDE